MSNASPNSNDRYSATRVALRRAWRRAQHFVYQVLERPAFRAGVIILISAAVMAVILNQWEFYNAVSKDSQGNVTYLREDGPYGTLPKTVRNVTVFLFSGFDAEQPQTDIGFLLALICIFHGLGILALLTGDLASLLVTAALASKGRRRIRARDHIVICGWHYTAQALVEQLISRERNPRREIVVVDSDTDELQVYDPDVHLVHGDPTRLEVLGRANTANAHTAIIPIDWKLSEDNQDSRTTLAAMAVHALNEDIYTCVEVLYPHNKRHIERTRVDEVICLGDFSQKVISASAVAHGLSRLMADILTFNKGSEIYRVPMPAALAGRSFRWLLRTINEKTGAILVSVQRGEQTHTNPPGEFLLEAGDKLFVLSELYPEGLEQLAAAR